MRPRVFPAEDEQATDVYHDSLVCFNEAAGIPRGRLFVDYELDAVRHASMRPRVFPAEDAKQGETSSTGKSASMRPRVFPAEDPWSPRTGDGDD